MGGWMSGRDHAEVLGVDRGRRRAQRVADGDDGVVASAQTATGTVTVVHGLRGVVADVYIDGTLALPAFQPERVTDPIAVPAGPHRVEIRLAGAPATDPPAVTGDVDVVADARQSIVAHLDSAGNPAITAYIDDATPVPAGDARAVIRHTAAAPPVDVSLNDSVVAARADRAGLGVGRCAGRQLPGVGVVAGHA